LLRESELRRAPVVSLHQRVWQRELEPALASAAESEPASPSGQYAPALA